MLNNGAEGILDGWVVALDEVILDELDRERRLANRAAAYDSYLSLLDGGHFYGNIEDGLR